MNLNIGDKVHYNPTHGKKENGIIKAHHPTDPTVVFVVYKCGDNWRYYQNYTGESTKITDLKGGWV